RGTARANKLTLRGSGRVSKTNPIEDALVQYIKDLRRKVVVCRDTIVHAATRLMPDFFKDKSRGAALTWCSRFMRRRRLTVLRVTRSERKVKEELEEFNMDQMAIFQSMGSRVTINFIGSQQVPAIIDGSDSYRCTLAITASGDGRILPPHFVFKGKPGGSVEAEVTAFTHLSVAITHPPRFCMVDCTYYQALGCLCDVWHCRAAITEYAG
ncbi:TPA: hypothetical protein N0F65_004033, partial [Lagenidium giganteum]